MFSSPLVDVHPPYPNKIVLYHPSSAASEEKAQSFVDSWADRNYPNAYVVKTGNELTGDIWFRVRVGNFATRLDAENFGTELATEINSGFWVASKD